jgi:hypothetical protein
MSVGHSHHLLIATTYIPASLMTGRLLSISVRSTASDACKATAAVFGDGPAPIGYALSSIMESACRILFRVASITHFWSELNHDLVRSQVTVNSIDMLATLIPNLSILIVTVRRNMFAAVMTTLLLLMLIMGWTARGNISTWLQSNPSPEQQADRISRSLRSDNKINRVLQSDLIKANGDRLFIRQFTDQIDATTRTVVPSMTVTYFTTAAGVRFPTENMSTPRAYLSDIIQLVWYDDKKAPKCARLAATDVKDTFYAKYLRDNGVAVMFACPVTDLTGAPIGLIFVSYLTNEKSRPSDEKIYEILSSTSVRIAGYLNDITAPEKTTWLRKLLDY